MRTGIQNLVICGTTSPLALEKLNIDPQLKAFRPAHRQKEALIEISRLKNGKAVTAQLNREIVGYITFHPPDEFERWAAGPGEILELGAIEVSPKVRKYGIAGRMMEAAFADQAMEQFIVLSTEYYWHWDLEGTSMHVWEYREMMRRIMERVNMTEKDTDEEEIASHPANMLMVRYGKNVPSSAVRKFESLLYLK